MPIIKFFVDQQKRGWFRSESLFFVVVGLLETFQGLLETFQGLLETLQGLLETFQGLLETLQVDLLLDLVAVPLKATRIGILIALEEADGRRLTAAGENGGEALGRAVGELGNGDHAVDDDIVTGAHARVAIGLRGGETVKGDAPPNTERALFARIEENLHAAPTGTAEDAAHGDRIMGAALLHGLDKPGSTGSVLVL